MRRTFPAPAPTALAQERQDLLHVGGREGLLGAGGEVLEVHGAGFDFGGAVDGDEGDGLLGGVVELLLELAGFGVDFDGDAGFAEGFRQGEDIAELVGLITRRSEVRVLSPLLNRPALGLACSV